MPAGVRVVDRLQDLADVDVAGITNGASLVWQGGRAVPGPAPVSAQALSDAVAAVTPASIGAATPAQVSTAVGLVTPLSIGAATPSQVSAAVAAVTPASIGAATPASVSAAVAAVTPASIGAATPASVGAAVAAVTPASLGVPVLAPGATQIVQTTNAAAVPLVAQGAASQTANVLEVRDSGGAARVQMNAAGTVTATNFLASSALRGAALQNTSGGNVASIGSNPMLIVTANAAGTVPVVIRGSASQTGDLQQWQTSTPSTVASVSSAGVLTVAGLTTAANVNVLGLRDPANAGPTVDMASNKVVIAARNVGDAPLVVKGAASQTGDLTQWRDSADAVKSSVNSFGSLLLRTATQFGSSALSVLTPSATSEGVVVRPVAAQTANLTEWQNSSGTARTVITASAGIYTLQELRLSMVVANSGGAAGAYVALGNVTTPPATSPIGGGVLYSEAGALKWKGSSGTVTIVAPA